MPRTARKNKRENLLEEKRKLLDKLNAVDLQIKEADKEAKGKWDESFLKGVMKIPARELGDEYYSGFTVESVLARIRESFARLKRKEEGITESAPQPAENAESYSAPAGGQKDEITSSETIQTKNQEEAEAPAETEALDFMEAFSGGHYF